MMNPVLLTVCELTLAPHYQITLSGNRSSKKYSRMLTRIRLIYITFLLLFLKNVVITFFSPVFSGFMLFTALQMSPTKIQCSHFQSRSEPRDESIRAWDIQMLEQPVVNCFTFVCFALILSSLCLAILVGKKNS